MLHPVLFDDPTATSSASGTGSLVFLLVALVFTVLVIAAEWRIFSKAGQPGWAVLIPIYNTIVLLRVAGRSGWWFLLFLIPIVNFIVLIIVMNDLSKAFGKGIGTTLGLIFLSPFFIMILGFGGAQYVRAAQAPAYAR